MWWCARWAPEGKPTLLAHTATWSRETCRELVERDERCRQVRAKGYEVVPIAVEQLEN